MQELFGEAQASTSERGCFPVGDIKVPRQPGVLTPSKNMANLKALVTNVELSSTITFPTLKKLSANGKAFGSSLMSITADKMKGTNCGKWGLSLQGRPLGTSCAPQGPVHAAPPLAVVEVPWMGFPRQWVTLGDLALKGKMSCWKKAKASQRFSLCHRWVYPVRTVEAHLHPPSPCLQTC